MHKNCILDLSIIIMHGCLCFCMSEWHVCLSCVYNLNLQFYWVGSLLHSFVRRELCNQMYLFFLPATEELQIIVTQNWCFNKKHIFTLHTYAYCEGFTSCVYSFLLIP